MKRLIFLVLFLLNCTHITYIGKLENTKTYNDPLAVTLIKTDQTRVEVYGRIIPYAEDSIFLVVKDRKKYVKFNAYDNLFLVRDSSWQK